MKRSLTCGEVIEVIESYFKGYSQAHISSTMGISEKAVYNILYLKTYDECSRDYILTMFRGFIQYFSALEERKKKGLGRKY